MTTYEKIKDQILAVRDSGKVNMLDVRGVQHVASDMGFYHLVAFIELHKSGYVNFIMGGDDKYLKGARDD